jgi:lipid-binding SYLF domain-containing protein
MKKFSKIAVMLISAALVLAIAGSAFAETAHMRRIRLATELIQDMTDQGSDTSALGDVIKSGKGVAIFPAVTKAGLVFGGQYGEGLVLLRNPNGTWSGPAYMNITGGSFGLQIGVQSVGLVLVITNQKGLQAFTGGNSFKLGGDIAVAAGPLGRDAAAATDAKAKASIYSYSMSKGLFAGLTIDGSVINQNRDASKAYWGYPLSAKGALNKPATDKRIQPLVQALKKLIGEVK